MFNSIKSYIQSWKYIKEILQITDTTDRYSNIMQAGIKDT